VEAPRNSVRDHNRMDKTQHTGPVAVVILPTFAPALVAQQLAPVAIADTPLPVRTRPGPSVSG
jgi:hypothetical protein